MKNIDFAYDNRDWLTRVSFRRGPSAGAFHYVIKINGKKIIYCYIRKNACSAFKKMFTGESKVINSSSNWDDITFMNENHRAVYPMDFKCADHIIFVYRDPLERAVSLYKNKFVMRSGAEDIFVSYQEHTGQDPEEASFEDFIHLYLCKEFKGLDPHVKPQRQHLLPIKYTDAIPMSRLAGCMNDIVGTSLSAKYFATKTNSTIDSPVIESLYVSKTSSSELHAEFLDTQRIPATRSFLDSATSRKLLALYKCDRIFSDKDC